MYRALPVLLAFLCKRSRLFINLLISGLTQGRWRFVFVILDGINLLITSWMESAIMDQLITEGRQMGTKAFILPPVKLIDSPRRFWGKFFGATSTSKRIASWSLMPGMTWHPRIGLLVVESTRSNVLPEAGRVRDFTW